MSRVPRDREYLKTGFTAEAASAARFRAYAAHAERDERPNLARRWRELAERKDALAIRQLEAAGQVRPAETAIADALAEEQYENDVLYPKMIRDAGAEAAGVLHEVVAAQAEDVETLDEMRRQVQAATADI